MFGLCVSPYFTTCQISNLKNQAKRRFTESLNQLKKRKEKNKNKWQKIVRQLENI